jgi:hypothetical protein
VKYIVWLGGPKTAPDDSPPGVKTVWKGLQKLYTLLGYRELRAFNFFCVNSKNHKGTLSP